MIIIKVHCYHCEEYYEIKGSNSKVLHNLNIRKAVCPYCQTPRDCKFFNNQKIQKIKIKIKLGECEICGEPAWDKEVTVCHKHLATIWKKKYHPEYNSYMRIYRYVDKLLHKHKVIQ